TWRWQPRGRYCARRADSVPAQTDHRQGRDPSHRSGYRRSCRLKTPRYRGKAKRLSTKSSLAGRSINSQLMRIIENGKITSPKIVCCNFCKGLFLKAGWRWVDRNYRNEKLRDLQSKKNQSIHFMPSLIRKLFHKSEAP